MRGGISVKDKYCVWSDVRLFRQLDIEKFEILLTQNKETIDTESLTIDEKYKCLGSTERFKRLFDIDTLEIIARLALGGAMTCMQLTCYLQLLGYNVTYNIVKSKLTELKNMQYINVHRISDLSAQKKTDAVYLMEDGILVARNIGIPVVKGADISRKYSKADRKKSIEAFVAINTVILKHLIYNRDELVRFSINNPNKRQHCGRIDSPLIIDTNSNRYIYWQYSINEHNDDDIRDMVDDWTYMEKNFCKFVPVVMCKSKTHVTHILKEIQKTQYKDKYLITISQFVTANNNMYTFCYEWIGKSLIELQLTQL